MGDVGQRMPPFPHHCFIGPWYLLSFSAYRVTPACAHGHCFTQLTNSGQSCTFPSSVPSPVPWSCSAPLAACPGSGDTHKCLCLGPSLLDGLCISRAPPCSGLPGCCLVTFQALSNSADSQTLPSPPLLSFQAQLHLRDPPPSLLQNPYLRGHHPIPPPNPHQPVPSGSQISLVLSHFGPQFPPSVK